MVDAGIRIERIGAGFSRWQELLNLIHASFCYMDGLIDPPSSAHRLTTDGLRDKAREEIGLVAFDGDAILGCAFLAERADHIYLGKLAVAPALQGRGIGRALMAAAES
jgi:predicted N-acetyltransferase YhbS